MDQLPELALFAVFKHLPLCDQIKIRAICKQWKTIIEESLGCRKALVLFYRTAVRPLVWFHSDHPVNLLDSVIVNRKFKKSQIFKQLFRRIERLYVVCRLEELLKKNFINFANRYRHLRSLQVDTLNDPFYIDGRLKIRFNLPNLESFCLNTAYKSKLFQLKCPKLEKLSVPCHFMMDERFASFKESLKFLKVDSFECKQGFELPNLEVLFFQMILPIDISRHKKLQLIHFICEHYRGYPLWITLFSSRRSVLEARLNGLFEQKNRLERNELQIYCEGIRCVPRPEGMFLRKIKRNLVKSDLELVSKDGDIKFEKQNWMIYYESEFDEKIAEINDDQEKLARCLTTVTLGQTLSKELALNAKFKILFRYIKKLLLWKNIRTQSDLDRLPDLFPHLVELELRHGRSCEETRYAILYSTRYPDVFDDDGALNFRFLARFGGLQKLTAENLRVSPSELREVLKNCRFLELLEIHLPKLDKLENEGIRTTLIIIRIFMSENEFRVHSKWEYSVKDEKTIQSQNFPEEKFDCLQEVVNSLEQRDYLRKEKKE